MTRKTTPRMLNAPSRLSRESLVLTKHQEGRRADKEDDGTSPFSAWLAALENMLSPPPPAAAPRNPKNNSLKMEESSADEADQEPTDPVSRVDRLHRRETTFNVAQK